MSDSKHGVDQHSHGARRRSVDRKAGTVRTPRRSTGQTQEIDRHVGARIRARRIVLGLTQQAFADLVGVSNQKVYRIERGINRVLAGQLFEIAQAFGVPVDYFFDGLDQYSERSINEHERMCLEFACTFAQIPDRRHQEALSQLVRSLASA